MRDYEPLTTEAHGSRQSQLLSCTYTHSVRGNGPKSPS